MSLSLLQLTQSCIERLCTYSQCCKTFLHLHFNNSYHDSDIFGSTFARPPERMSPVYLLQAKVPFLKTHPYMRGSEIHMVSICRIHPCAKLLMFLDYGMFGVSKYKTSRFIWECELISERTPTYCTYI